MSKKTAVITGASSGIGLAVLAVDGGMSIGKW